MFKRLAFIIPVILVAIIIGDPFFIVNQTQQAIVLQFGQLANIYTTPGLKFKIPFIQNVKFYDKRVLEHDLDPISVTTADQKRLYVDTYTRYRIDNPLLFFQSVKPANEMGARMRLDAFISSTVRNILGKLPLRNLLSDQRSAIMQTMEKEVQRLCKPLGLEIIDLRIIRTELPYENRSAVFSRMNAELEKIAKENRAKGFEIAQSIKSSADKEKEVILAKAKSEAKIRVAQSEAQALKMVSDAYKQNKDFYRLYSFLNLYKDSFNQNTSIILSTDNPILKDLNNQQGR